MTTQRATVVTPGNYDGVHVGHRALLAAARELSLEQSSKLGAPLTVTALTFDPHPAVVLAPSRAPALLTTVSRRRELLLSLGADAVEILRFDRALASLSAEAFVRSVLVTRLGAAGVVIGPDFRFGQGRTGNADTLRALSATLGFEVRTVGPVELDHEVISSTRIRAALEAGDIGAVTALLGRVHDVAGRVVEGDRRGRTIGFPTANLDCEPVLLPKDGVYAIVARVLDEPSDRLRFGVANLGVRPTFAAGRSVEAHLFDFDEDLYGRTVRVGFVARLRGEVKFDGLDALKAQIERDAVSARERLDAADSETWSWI